MRTKNQIRFEVRMQRIHFVVYLSSKYYDHQQGGDKSIGGRN